MFTGGKTIQIVAIALSLFTPGAIYFFVPLTPLITLDKFRFLFFQKKKGSKKGQQVFILGVSLFVCVMTQEQKQCVNPRFEQDTFALFVVTDRYDENNGQLSVDIFVHSALIITHK